VDLSGDEQLLTRKDLLIERLLDALSDLLLVAVDARGVNVTVAQLQRSVHALLRLVLLSTPASSTPTQRRSRRQHRAGVADGRQEPTRDLVTSASAQELSVIHQILPSAESHHRDLIAGVELDGRDLGSRHDDRG